MPEIHALSIAQVAGSLVSDDGQHMVLRLVQADGADVPIAIPRGEILKLAEAAAVSHAQSDKALNVDPNQKDAFHVTWWELGFDESSGTAVLTLTFGAGGKLSFALSGNMPRDLLETLQVHVGSATPTPPERRN